MNVCLNCVLYDRAARARPVFRSIPAPSQSDVLAWYVVAPGEAANSATPVIARAELRDE